MRRLLLLLAVASPALAQQPRSVGAGALREVHIQFTDEWARVAESGVLTFPRQGLTSRFKVTRSVGGDTAPQQQVGVDLSRPFTVTYDNSGSRCHQ